MKLRTGMKSALFRAPIGLAFATLALMGLGPSAARPPLSLTSADSTFDITAAIYAMPAGGPTITPCVGPPVTLYPGIDRCLVYTAVNHLHVPITVRTMTMALDPHYPAPPSGCLRKYLTLPTYTGALAIPVSGQADSPGLTVALQDSGTNQDNCQHTTLHFAFTGTAGYVEVYPTTTTVASSANPAHAGQRVTYRAEVHARASHDPVPSSPTGTVTFYVGSASPSNAIPGCTAVPVVSSARTNSIATCNQTLAGTASRRILAVYDNTDGNFDHSSGRLLQKVVLPGTPAPEHTQGPLPFTGADVVRTVTLGLAFISVGAGLLLVVRRRRRPTDDR